MTPAGLNPSAALSTAHEGGGAPTELSDSLEPTSGETISKPCAEYEFHPVAAIFPMMSEAELQALAEDIKSNGLREDIWVFDGQIIDGRNRYLACTIAGVEPRFREWDGEGSLVAWVLSVNLHRRHLTDQQRAMVAAKAKEEFAREARERSRSNLLQNKGSTDSLDSGCRTVGKAAAQAAAALQVSTDSVEKAARIVKSGDETLVAAATTGTVSLDAAATVATLPKAKQRRLVEQGKVREAAKTIKAEQKAAKARQATSPRMSEPATSPEHAAVSPPEPATAAAIPATSAAPRPSLQARWNQAFGLVLRVVRSNGPRLARKAISRIAGEVDLEVWIAGEDAAGDLVELERFVRDRVETVASDDVEEARRWVEQHDEYLREVIAAAEPDEEEQEFDGGEYDDREDDEPDEDEFDGEDEHDESDEDDDFE